MVSYQDFFPNQEKGGFFTPDKSESLQAPLSRMNQWLSENSELAIINVETVVLPNIYKTGEKGSIDPSLKVRPDIQTRWYQGFRVWYREGKF